jgi:hypothetical protein
MHVSDLSRAIRDLSHGLSRTVITSAVRLWLTIPLLGTINLTYAIAPIALLVYVHLTYSVIPLGKKTF